jgi:sporulation related protein
MRIVFFVLLLGNVAFFAWSWFAAASGESQLLQQQLRPEAIKLLTPEQVAKAAAKQVPAAPAKPAPQAAAVKPPEPVKLAACMELGGFNPAEVAKAQQALEPFAFGPRLSQRRVDEIAGFWVYIPPQANRQGANRKVAELKRLGVEEFFVVQDDPDFRFAISLGVFKSRDAARSRLAELRAKGVRSARVGARETQVPKIFFVVREVPDPVVTRLNELRQAFPGAELKECPPEEKRAAPA